MKPIIAVIFFLLSINISVFGADFYVSTAGSDSNPGTQAQPFATIQHAIDACPAPPANGSTIHLDGSTWNESPTITGKNITLIGDFNGPQGQGGRTTSKINGTLTIWQGSSPTSNEIKQLTAKSIVTHNLASFIFIDSCDIDGSTSNGITVSNMMGFIGGITITNCLVTNCSVHGIFIAAGGGSAALGNNTIHDNGQCGIYINYGIVETYNNTIYSCDGWGIYAFADYSSYNNNIHDNSLGGVYYKCNQAFYNNTITDNQGPGVQIDSCNPKFYNNTIQNNQNYGVYCTGTGCNPDLGGGALSSPGNNTISGNGTYDLYKTGSQNIYVKNNHWDATTEAQMASGFQKRTNITRFYDAFDYWQPGDPLSGAFIWMSSFPRNGVLDFATSKTNSVQVSSVGQLKASYAR